MKYLHWITIYIFLQVFGILSATEKIYVDKQHIGLNELVRDFPNVIQKPEKYIDINLFLENSLDREASGVYKLIPYYMKIYPKDRHQDRYIIQQHPFNGEFQLVKIENYLHHKNIRALFHPKKPIVHKKDLSTINTFQKYQQNIKGLVEKTQKLENRLSSMTEEIKKTKEENKSLRQHAQKFQENFKKQKEIYEKKLKENELKMEIELIELRSKNEEYQTKINELIKTVEIKKSHFEEQQNEFQKLKLQKDFKYKEEILDTEISNLKNELQKSKEEQKKLKENARKEKHEFEKEKIKMTKINTSQMTRLLELSQQIENAKTEVKISVEKYAEIEEYRLKYEKAISNFERHYYGLSENFEGLFLSITDIDQKTKLKQFLCDPTKFCNHSDYDYECALIGYGLFLYVEKIRLGGTIHIRKEKIFNPHDLALPTGENNYSVETSTNASETSTNGFETSTNDFETSTNGFENSTNNSY